MGQHKSKKIIPVDPTVVKTTVLPDTGPKKVLGSFLYQVKKPWVIVKDRTFGAPAVPGWDCTAAWRIEHDLGKLNSFDQVKDSLGNVTILYHGTANSNVADIVAEGLVPGRKTCMFGAGIYLGPVQKAFMYTSHEGGWGRERYLLEVVAVLGRVKECTASEHLTLNKLQTQGFDSAAGVKGLTQSWHGTLRHDEYILYSPDQVLVSRILEYQSRGNLNHREPMSSSLCERMKEGADVPPAKRAFQDLLTWKRCGATAHTRVPLSNGQTYWFCKGCIQSLKLKVGSPVMVRDSGGHLLTLRVRGSIS